ncbi:MAG: Oligosaccharide translocation protein rft1 [Sclerophora amabilis]|nr:MAG: Oligosaccharide translocation protein rft1 [Sclerophora amabilis]
MDKSIQAGEARKNPSPSIKKSLFSSSAQGATFLVLLQVGSRALTFAVNQVLLRYLSPELLGVSAQLELYLISVLFVARESFRVALQRQSDQNSEISAQTKDGSTAAKNGAPNGYVNADSPAGKTQTVVNISYIPIFLGIPLAVGFGYFYIYTTTPDVLDIPFFPESLKLFGISAFWELLTEPCFVVVQQKLLYKTRAAAETMATIARCLLTCSIAILSARTGKSLGVLPFAFGQMGYASTLLTVYYWNVWEVASTGGFSLSSQRILPSTSTESSAYLFSYFSRPLLNLSGSLFLQSGIKHVLTQGDALLIVALSSLTDQGTYALASNYGGLIARVLFQPIEESSRNLFAKLLSPGPGVDAQPDPTNVRAASRILSDITRLYLLLSLVASAVGPAVAPVLLRMVAGQQWADSGAGDVLSTYCYYIPLLALNGVTEAFVSAVASSAELHAQSVWMFAFSIGFASASYVFLRVLAWGAQGLVWANMVNMLLRIVWSVIFVKNYLQRNGGSLDPRVMLPSVGSVAASIGSAAILARTSQSYTGGLGDLLNSAAVAGPYLLLLIYFERTYLLQCYDLLRPNSNAILETTKHQ